MMNSIKIYLKRVEDVLFDRREDATERLLDFAETVKDYKKDMKLYQEWRNDYSRSNYPYFGERN